MAYIFDYDIQIDLIAQPVDAIYPNQPNYRAVGIDEHLQIIAKFSYFFSHDVDVTGYAVLDKRFPRPLFKLEFDRFSLTGDFYFNEYPLTRTSLGNLKMKFDESDKY